MNPSSIMQKLLQGAEVEWKPLGDVIKLQRGKRLVKSQLQDFGDYAVYQNSMTPLGYYHESNANSGTTFIISAGAAGEIGYSDENFWAADDVYFCITPNSINNKFLYYFLLNIKNKILNQVRRASIPRLSRTVVEKLEIPIPPLHVQTEIVRILDTFTALTAELTAELSMRQQQYNHYRNKLLDFSDKEVEWKTLDEIGEIIRGNGLQKKDLTDKGFPAIHYGQIFTKYGLSATQTFTFTSEEMANKLRKAEVNDLLIATTSENDEDVLKPLAWLGEQTAISGDMMMLKHQQNVKYLAYYFQTTEFQKQKTKYITGAKVRRVSKDNLAKFEIPIPPLAEQERIVAILDKFDTLTHSISEGLPREIELRQQQYEYYRDLLLSFPKAQGSA